MGSKLKFKGEKVAKKRKHQSEDALEASSSKAHDGDEREGWIDLPSPEQACGPLYILHAATDELPATCMAINTTLNNKIFPHVLADPEDPALQEPSDIHHVFVCTLLPDAQTKCTLRSASGRFLAIDSTGTFGAPTEARGAQEEFEFIAHPTVAGAFALKSVYYGKYLTIDEVAGGRLDYRGDADAIGADEAFTVKMQAKFEHENERKQQSERPTRASDGLVIIKDVKGAEDDRIRQFQARGHGRLVSSAEDTKELKKARKEGGIAEKMLDRRMKLKHDRYC